MGEFCEPGEVAVMTPERYSLDPFVDDILPEGWHPGEVVEPAALRDQFAMAALTGLISGYTTAGHPESWDNFALMAYHAADAMMNARDG